eukprot:COSAG06_NODE_4652_length_4066_cov_6.628183_1_plen_73_part_00
MDLKWGVGWLFSRLRILRGFGAVGREGQTPWAPLPLLGVAIDSRDVDGSSSSTSRYLRCAGSDPRYRWRQLR